MSTDELLPKSIREHFDADLGRGMARDDIAYVVRTVLFYYIDEHRGPIATDPEGPSAIEVIGSVIEEAWRYYERRKK